MRIGFAGAGSMAAAIAAGFDQRGGPEQMLFADASSGRAVALTCEALRDAGTESGLGAGLSARLIGLTAAGTGELLLRHDPEDLRVAVASPGGNTEAGLEALAEARVEDALAAAVRASLERMAGTR